MNFTRNDLLVPLLIFFLINLDHSDSAKIIEEMQQEHEHYATYVPRGPGPR